MDFDEDADDVDPELASALAPRYVRLSLIGEGGMGMVFRAYDQERKREVALKVILPEHGRDPGFVARFRREEQAMLRVRHPNVVELLELGDAGGVAFIAMEFLEGRSLRDVLREGVLRGAAPDTRQVATDVAALCDGLEAVHAAGILHRDIKPENVMLTKAGPKLMDFSLAKLMDEGARGALTRTGQIVGTMRYLPPELLEGHVGDRRSDVYQMGLLLYESLSGHRPYLAQTLVELLRDVKAGPPPRPGGPAVDDRLARLALRAVALVPELRPASAAALALELRAWLEGRVVGAPLPERRPSAPVAVAPAASRPRAKLPWQLTAAAVAIVLLVAAAAAAMALR